MKKVKKQKKSSIKFRNKLKKHLNQQNNKYERRKQKTTKEIMFYRSR